MRSMTKTLSQRRMKPYQTGRETEPIKTCAETRHRESDRERGPGLIPLRRAHLAPCRRMFAIKLNRLSRASAAGGAFHQRAGARVIESSRSVDHPNHLTRAGGQEKLADDIVFIGSLGLRVGTSIRRRSQCCLMSLQKCSTVLAQRRRRLHESSLPT